MYNYPYEYQYMGNIREDSEGMEKIHHIFHILNETYLFSRNERGVCSGHHPLDAFTDDSNWVLFDLSETKKHPMISPRE